MEAVTADRVGGGDAWHGGSFITSSCTPTTLNLLLLLKASVLYEHSP